MSQEPLFLHLENSGPNHKGVMYRKFLAQNLRNELSGRRPLLHLPSASEYPGALFYGQHPTSIRPFSKLGVLGD